MHSREDIFKSVSNIEGWLNPPVVELLYRLVKKGPPDAVIVEIGSWKGKSTVLMALASQASANIYAIDPHIGSHEHKELYGEVDTFTEFKSNLERYAVSSKVNCIRKTSNTAYDDVPSGIDLLWIDGSHDYKDVSYDFKSYYQKLKPGGFVAWHDYKWQGVKQMTWEMLAEKGYGLVRRVEDTHYFRKPRKGAILFDLLNQLRLNFYRSLQNLKRLKRKWRKRRKN